MPADEFPASVQAASDEPPAEAASTLRSATEDGPAGIVAFPDAATAATAAAAAAPRRIQPVDYRQQSMFSAPELRKLRLRHDDFIRSLATRLSIYLRLELGLSASKLQTMTHRKFTDSLPQPAHLVLFKIESFSGIGLLDIPPRLGLSVVDRMLGGAGTPVASAHELTEIEVALLDQVAQIILKEWCRHVAHLADSAPAVLGYESCPRYLQTAASDINMLVLSLEVRLGDAVEQMQLAFPQPMIEPLVGQLNAALEEKSPAPAPAPVRPLTWNSQLDELRVPLTAEWHGLAIKARELAHLKVGDVLPVDPRCSCEVEVRLARIPKFLARLGKRGNSWAVELIKPVTG